MTSRNCKIPVFLDWRARKDQGAHESDVVEHHDCHDDVERNAKGELRRDAQVTKQDGEFREHHRWTIYDYGSQRVFGPLWNKCRDGDIPHMSTGSIVTSHFARISFSHQCGAYDAIPKHIAHVTVEQICRSSVRNILQSNKGRVSYPCEND